jgi:integrase
MPLPDVPENPTLAKNGWTIRQPSGRTWMVRFQVGDRERTLSTGTKDRAEALARGARIHAEAMADAPERPCDRLERETEEHRLAKIAAMRLARLTAAVAELRAHVEDETKKAERHYAERYGTSPLPPELLAEASPFPTFERAHALWIEEFRTTHARVTLDVWAMYGRNLWPGYFTDLERITHVRLKEYMRARLGVVKRESVRKELFALKSFLTFCSETFDLPAVEVPKLPKRALGVAYVKRRRKAASELAPDQVRALLRELPEWGSTSHLDADQYPIRALFLVLYETGLRPSTITRLSVPEHYVRGQRVLHLTPDVDKARYGRDVPLTKRARRVLDYLIKKMGPDFRGPIFGTDSGAGHDYRKRLQRAAFKVLPREVAASFCGAHLRSARITHLLESGANIVGVQHLAGHKQISTTAKYVRAGFRAATDAINVWEARA